ncbi:MAG: hypothetical protein LBO71_09825 [Prevotellaceae bacterium]|jgi:hypothetical protein|nr:hypothetical protein [Prevotellaceae bacterium]
MPNLAVVSAKLCRIWWLYPPNYAEFGGCIRQTMPNLVVVSAKLCRIWWLYPPNYAKFGGYIRQIMPNLADISEKITLIFRISMLFTYLCAALPIINFDVSSDE